MTKLKRFHGQHQKDIKYSINENFKGNFKDTLRTTLRTILRTALKQPQNNWVVTS